MALARFGAAPAGQKQRQLLFAPDQRVRRAPWSAWKRLSVPPSGITRQARTGAAKPFRLCASRSASLNKSPPSVRVGLRRRCRCRGTRARAVRARALGAKPRRPSRYSCWACTFVTLPDPLGDASGLLSACDLSIQPAEMMRCSYQLAGSGRSKPLKHQRLIRPPHEDHLDDVRRQACEGQESSEG